MQGPRLGNQILKALIPNKLILVTAHNCITILAKLYLNKLTKLQLIIIHDNFILMPY